MSVRALPTWPLPCCVHQCVHRTYIAACTLWHTVGSKDTCGRLLKKMRMTRNDFAQLNLGVRCSMMPTAMLGKQVCVGPRESIARSCLCCIICSAVQSCSACHTQRGTVCVHGSWVDLEKCVCCDDLQSVDRTAPLSGTVPAVACIAVSSWFGLGCRKC